MQKKYKNVLLVGNYQGVTAGGFPLSYPEADEGDPKIIGNGIVNDDDQPIFYYYNKQYPIDTENNPLATPSDVQDIGMVKLDMHVNVDTSQVPNSAHMETFVRPRNIR